MLTQGGREWVRSEAWPLLGEEQRLFIQMQWALIDHLSPMIHTLDRRVEHVGREIPAVALLETIPGIGPITASALAASITGDDVRRMKQKYPGVPVVTYVNTSAEVKAESDICCTSANAVNVVEAMGVDRVILLPDEYLAKNVAALTDVEVIAWRGLCEVHERFSGEEIRQYRESTPDLVVLAHPECHPDVLAEADYAGSTSSMIRYVKEKRPARVLMVTECSMSDNVAAETPDVEFIRPCNLCPHMKSITLQNILESLQEMRYEVTIPADVAEGARRAVQRMVDLGAEGRDFADGVKAAVTVESRASLGPVVGVSG